MGLTYVHARLRKSEARGPSRDVRLLVDSGAIYSVLPEEDWRAMRLKPEREVEFTLADGALLGAVTLETLGFMLNPLTREILPMRMALSHIGRSVTVSKNPMGIAALNPSYKTAKS